MENGSVYLLVDAEEIHLGSVAEVLEAPRDTMQVVSRALVRMVADIVDELVSDNASGTERNLTLEVR